MNDDERSNLAEGDATRSHPLGSSAKLNAKNLQQEIGKLKAAPSWHQAAGRSSETLAKYPGFSLVLMLMKAGTQIGKHHAAGRIAVQVMQGKIRMHLPEGQSVDLSVGDLLTLDRGIEHEVEACEESAFLLTVA